MSPAVKCLPRMKPNQDFSRQHQSWREECYRQFPRTSWGHCREGGCFTATLPKRRWRLFPLEQWEAETAEGGWGWPDLVLPLCILPREAQQVPKASADVGEKKKSGQGAVAQGSPPGTAHLQQDISPVDAILAGVLLLTWRQKWQGLQRGLLGLNHTLSTPHTLLHNISELQTFGIAGHLPHNLGRTLPQGQQVTGPQQPSAGNGQTAKKQQ